MKLCMLKPPLRKRIIIPISIVILLVILWLTGVIPTGLCILSATNYINKQYPNRSFDYSFIEYSKAHGEYFVHFVDKDGKKIALMVSPFGVLYDPLNPPG